nr:MAG TPA: hypothetical protein [Caudoviricetes sp.]
MLSASLSSWPSSFPRRARPSAHRLTTASGVGYSATRYARQRIRGSPWIRMRTRQTGPRRVMSR